MPVWLKNPVEGESRERLAKTIPDEENCQLRQIMEMETKKRGRPAQLLQIAELHAFVEFLEQQEQLSDLISSVKGFK
jgi:hypothetical protein